MPQVYTSFSSRPLAAIAQSAKAIEAKQRSPDKRYRLNWSAQHHQCVDTTLLPRKNQLFSRARSKPSQGSVPAGLTLASNFSFCFQCQVDSSVVLRRPIESTGVTGKGTFHFKWTVM